LGALAPNRKIHQLEMHIRVQMQNQDGESNGIDKENARLKKENERLRDDVRELKEKIDRILKEFENTKKEFEKYKSKYPATEAVPSFVKPAVKSRHKKNGQKAGHTGYSRHIPERVDAVKPLLVEKCPDCGGELSDVQEIRTRYVEDIPEIPSTVVTEYQIERRYCGNCKKLVEADVPDALPNARFGLRLMLLVAFLRVGLAMPVNKVVALLKAQYNLAISDGEIVNICAQVADAFNDYYAAIQETIKNADTKHIDETGWRIDGKNCWLWAFINKEVALYAIRRRRNHDVPASILGNQSGKISTDDRFPAYNVLERKTGLSQQKCWVHILRNSKELAKRYWEAKSIHRRLKGAYRKAKSYEHHATQEQVDALLGRIDRVTARTYKHSVVAKFVQSVCVRHRGNLFRFATNPAIDGDNNIAERAIRKGVIIRKVCGGNRSERGARITERLLSVVETLKLQGENPLAGMRNAINAS